MFMAFGELTPLSWGLIGLGILFAVQLTLCLLAKRISIKCIPLGLIALGLLYCIASYIGVFGTYSAGALPGHQLAALICGVVVGIAAVGVSLAWAAYGIIHLLRRK